MQAPQKLFHLFYGVVHLWCSGKGCLIDSNVTSLHSILDFILVMLDHVCVLLFVPRLFLCQFEAIINHVLFLTVVVGKLPRAVLVVPLSLAFLEWTPWMSIGVPGFIITEPHLVGLTIIWPIKHVASGGLTVVYLIYLYNWLHCFKITFEECPVPLFGPGDRINHLEDIFHWLPSVLFRHNPSSNVWWVQFSVKVKVVHFLEYCPI